MTQPPRSDIPKGPAGPPPSEPTPNRGTEKPVRPPSEPLRPKTPEAPPKPPSEPRPR